MNIETLNILEMLKNDNVFITGGGGVGKSHITKEIIEDYKLKMKYVIALGSSGTAAVNISGQTLHSFFMLGISKNLEELKLNDKVKKINTYKLNNILSVASLIVIDEISLVSKDVMDMVLYRLENSNFKGKFLIVGDFCQIPPIIKDKRVKDIFAFESKLWYSLNLKIVYLEEIKRNTDLEFSKTLQRIRINNIIDEDIEVLKRLTKNILKEEESTTLVSKNSQANIINKRELEKIDSPLRTFQMQTIVYDKNRENFLQNFKDSIPANENLNIKIGAKILFIKNTKSYYNGERGIILDIIQYTNMDYESKNIYDYKLLVQKEMSGQIIEVFPEKWSLTKFETYYDSFSNTQEVVSIPVFEAYQFPVKLCYAITVHKSQGMSIDNLICDMRELFADSQFYVSISRSVNPNNLKIIFKNNENISEEIKDLLNLNPLVKRFYNLEVEEKKVDEKVLKSRLNIFDDVAIF